MDAKPSFIAQAPSPQPCYLQPAGLYDSLPNGYTHVVTVQEPLRWLFVSGQGGENALAELPDSFAQQAAQPVQFALQFLGCNAVAAGRELAQDHPALERRTQRGLQNGKGEHWERAVHTVRILSNAGHPGA